ncbi:MAG TPA: SIS domain-containing protein [Stenomitos sp.]
MHGDFTFREILEQPEVWQRVLDGLRDRLEALDLDGIEELVFVGCGSSYHLAEAAAKIFGEVTGARARFTPASEVFLAPHTVFHKGDRIGFIALSRTGETSEVLKAVELFKRLRQQGDLSGPVYGFTCTPDSGLVAACDRTVLVPSTEQSLVMTQAFTGTLLALALWASLVSPDEDALGAMSALDGAGQQVLERAALIKEIASYAEIRHFVFLGSGILHPIACEGALKLQEMALVAEVSAYHALEYRHGPKSTIGADTLVVMLVSQTGARYERELLAELKELGARTLVLSGSEAETMAPHADYQVSVGAYPDALRAMLYAPLLQLLAYHRAILRGTDPDSPQNLSRSVIL